jgi:DNA-binding MarR family transcriptional regulator
LIRRKHDTPDRRYVLLHVTAKGQRLLRALSDAHERELYELAPRLVRTLTSIRTSAARSEATETRGSYS